MKPEKRTVKKASPPRRKTTVLQRLLLVSSGFVLLAVIEIILRLLPLGAPTPSEEDPYVGFSSSNPLFVNYRAADGSRRVTIAPGKTRWFNPQDFAADKGLGTFRIFTLGGSTTYGHPFMNATSFSGWLEKLLNRNPGSPIKYQVINCGGISYASYREVRILQEILPLQPDLIVDLTGHNEFLEARTYEAFFRKPSFVLQAREQLAKLRTYQLLSRVYRSARKNSSGGAKPPAAESPDKQNILPGEVQTILDRSAGLDFYHRDSLFSKGVFEHFRFNIQRMINISRRSGVRLVFLDPVDNIKDFSPFKSQGREDLDNESRLKFANLTAEGISLMSEGRIPEGIELFKEAMQIDSLNAGCNFILGRSYLETGDTALASKYLLAARELDVCPLRPQEPIHRILKEETDRANIPLLDLQALFQLRSPGGLIGDELMIDHVHPTPEGNLLIALKLLGWMEQQGLIEANSAPSPAQLDSLYAAVLDSLPPEYFRHGIVVLAKTLIWAKKYREAYVVLDNQRQLLAGDSEAQYLIGTALEALGSLPRAVEHLKQAFTLESDNLLVLSKLAALYTVLGAEDSASAIYERAVKLFPDNVPLLNDYGVFLGKSGQYERALAVFHRIERLDPGLAGLDNNIGLVYSLMGNFKLAAETFEKAAGAHPDDPEACFNLGLLYSKNEKLKEAEEYLQEAIRIDPQHAGAHINLGNIYQETGRPELAEEQFNQALKINPDLPETYINLALLYRSTGKNDLSREIASLGLQRFPDNPQLVKLSKGDQSVN